jgi:hypothetical protein
MPAIADRVKETSTTTGTSDIVLAGAATQFRSFLQAYGARVTSEIPYTMQGQSGGEWEMGYGTFNGSTGLSRDVILSSSTGSKVSFSAGTKDVFVTLPTDAVADYGIGFTIVIARGWAMP